MTNENLPSEEFLEAIVSAGSSCISCTFCDRVHFVSDPTGWDWESGEHEELIANSEKEPDKYIAHEEDSVRWATLDGKQYVIGCQCNSAVKYEEFILTHKNQIVQYLKARAQRIARESTQESSLVRGL